MVWNKIMKIRDEGNNFRTYIEERKKEIHLQFQLDSGEIIQEKYILCPICNSLLKEEWWLNHENDEIVKRNNKTCIVNNSKQRSKRSD